MYLLVMVLTLYLMMLVTLLDAGQVGAPVLQVNLLLW